MTDNVISLPSLLDSGKTPAEWIEVLAAKGITYSERSLREKANKLGARLKIGRTMLITQDHMETILRDSERCHSKHTSVVENGGPGEESNTREQPSPTITNAALGLIQSKMRGGGAGPKKNANDDSTYSDQKPKRKKAR